MKLMRRLAVALAGLVAVTALPVTAAQAAPVKATMLLYQREAPGLKPYPSRLLVTRHFVRFDDGHDNGDYALFNRTTRTVYSVTREDRSILVIKPRPVGIKPPLPLSLTATEVAIPAKAPMVAGHHPRHYRLRVNGKACYDVVAVKGLMPGAVAALRSFRKVMAGQHARTLPAIPPDMRDACDMAINTFHPNRILSWGMPLQEWDRHGRGQKLVDFKTGEKVDSALFTLPKGFVRYTPEHLPGR